MHWFNYKDGDLYAEDVRISDIAKQHGTPLYIYSRATLVRNINTIQEAFSGIDHLTCYSVKANSNASLLTIMSEYGLGADIVSGGELYRSLLAGIPAKRIVYSGVGKTESEIRYGLESGILMFNIESESELHAIDRIAGEMGLVAPIAFRINPEVDPKTHPYIATGLKTSKFGIPHSEALGLYRKASEMDHIEIIGIDAHIGSQLIDITPFKEAAERLSDLIDEIRGIGIDLSIIDIGGGLGIQYHHEDPPSPVDWAQMIIPAIKHTGCRLIIEPGRYLVGNAGILITKVLYIKTNGDKTFVIVDAGMNDIGRPSLYGSYHGIIPIKERKAEKKIVDIVGPICESGDFIAKDREISMPVEGDYLAVLCTGAYGMSMASNYNSRPTAAEIIANHDTIKMVTRRETYSDLISRESD